MLWRMEEANGNTAVALNYVYLGGIISSSSDLPNSAHQSGILHSYRNECIFCRSLKCYAKITDITQWGNSMQLEKLEEKHIKQLFPVHPVPADVDECHRF